MDHSILKLISFVIIVGGICLGYFTGKGYGNSQTWFGVLLETIGLFLPGPIILAGLHLVDHYPNPKLPTVFWIYGIGCMAAWYFAMFAGASDKLGLAARKRLYLRMLVPTSLTALVCLVFV